MFPTNFLKTSPAIHRAFRLRVFFVVCLCAGIFGTHIFEAQASVQNNQQEPLDRILQQKNFEKSQEKLFKKPVIKEKFYFKGVTKKDDKSCIKIENVAFEGANLLTAKDRNYLTQNLIGQCIYNDQIGNTLNDITNHYIGKGCTSARVYFVKYNSKNKTIYFRVAEGIIRSIVLSNIKNKEPRTDNISQSFSDKSQIFFAFPTHKGKVFDIADAEQGINQMNRLRSNNATIDIKPANIDGESDIIINNYKNNNALELGTSYDNSGSKSTGIYNSTYSINQDNLLKINDNLNFAQIRSSGSTTNMFVASMPFGYYTFSYSYSANQYSSETDNGVKISGTSTNNDYGISRLILREKNYELNLGTNLNFRNSTRKIAGVVDMASQKLSTGRIGVDYTLRQEKFILGMGFAYSKGLKINSAIDDQKDFSTPLQKDSSRAQFKKWAYNLNLYKTLGKYFSYSLQAVGQRSSDALYSSELLYVGGGKYTVRGLEYNGINGATGGYVKNDLTVNLREVLGNKNSQNQVMNFGLDVVKNIKPYVFYDSGYTKQIVAEGEKSKNEYISGAGAGVKYHGKYLNGEISYARNINAPAYVIQSNDRKKDAVYFGISGRYWLF